MPTVMRIKGYRFLFFSNDAREPVHIHVDSDDKYAKFWLEPIQLVKSVGYHASELSEIRKIISENVEAIRRRWDEYFHS